MIELLAGLNHHAGTIRSSHPLTVESIREQWAYTISVPIETAEAGIEPGSPLLISANLTVHEGQVGLIVVAEDLRTQLARLPPPVGPGHHSVEVVLEAGGPPPRLVFRNHTSGHRSCVFTVEEITIRRAPPDALTVTSRLRDVTTDGSKIDIAKLQGATATHAASGDATDSAVLDLLRRKWSTVPAGLADRRSSNELAALPDDELKRLWEDVHREATAGAGFRVRGWYQTLYRDMLRDKSVLEIGSGMGIDGIDFARRGARMTFVDIVESNLLLLRRLCDLFGVHDAHFVYLENLSSLDALPHDFDVVWCQGSLINAPFEFVARECVAILPHLKPDGRWIELAYPRERWERDGQPRFSVWGTMTDGEGTPWMEWYNLDRLLKRLAPARFDPILAFNFHNDDFNWFDLVRTK